MQHELEYDGKSLICHSILDGEVLARLIEANYDLTLPIECSLFSRSINDVYLVASQGQQFILRISRVRRYGSFDDRAYSFELELLRFLHGNGLPVVYPLARRDKETLGAINAPEGKRYYALFSYAEGNIVSSLNQEQSYILGQSLARFHLAANEFSPTHPRFHLDENYLINEPMRRLKWFSQLPQEDLDFLDSLCMSLRETIQSLSQQRDEYGIIHGDLWWRNVHFAGRRATLFDFDFCGYGWRVSDIASLRGNAIIYGKILSDDVVAALLEGYQSARPLTEVELAAMSDFAKITVVWALGVWTTVVDVLGTRWFYENFARVFANLKRWVEEDGRT